MKPLSSPLSHGWLILLALTACQPPTPPAADPAPDRGMTQSPAPRPAAPPAEPQAATLSLSGFGALRIGAPPAAGFRDDASIDGDCRIFTNPAQPGVAAMVIKGAVERITLSRGRAGAPTAQTSEGIGYGASEAAVRAAYSPLDEQPHEYLHPEGKNLYSGDGRSTPAYRFEIGTDGRVRHIHVGRAPALGYAEGCA